MKVNRHCFVNLALLDLMHVPDLDIVFTDSPHVNSIRQFILLSPIAKVSKQLVELLQVGLRSTRFPH